MHTEYRILNIVLSLEDNKPSVLCDIAEFEVDKENRVNTFVGLHRQVSAKYPYTQELLLKKKTEVVILDDLQFNGDLKVLIKKNKHLVLSQMDYQYKDYVYLICQLEDDSFLVYSAKNRQEVISYSTLRMYDDMGRLFNALIKVKKGKVKEKQIVVCGTNINDEKKRMTPVEKRAVKEGSLVIGKHGQFALDMTKLKSDKNVQSILIKSGQLESISVYAGGDATSVDFKMPDSVKNLLSTGRKYLFDGDYNILDLSSIQMLSKNALVLKGKVNKLILTEEAVKSSNLDFLVYSLSMYTGSMDYKINQLCIEGVTGDELLDLVINLLAELYFNTDGLNGEVEDFVIKKIVFDSSYINNLNNSERYDKWIEKGLTRFSMQLLENYMKAVGYYKKVLRKEGKKRNELSLQTLDMLAEYEESLINECEFFNVAKYILTDNMTEDSLVYKNISTLIEQNQAERVSATQAVLSKDMLIDSFLNNLK